MLGRLPYNGGEDLSSGQVDDAVGGCDAELAHHGQHDCQCLHGCHRTLHNSFHFTDYVEVST